MKPLYVWVYCGDVLSRAHLTPHGYVCSCGARLRSVVW